KSVATGLLSVDGTLRVVGLGPTGRAALTRGLVERDVARSTAHAGSRRSAAGVAGLAVAGLAIAGLTVTALIRRAGAVLRRWTARLHDTRSEDNRNDQPGCTHARIVA